MQVDLQTATTEVNDGPGTAVCTVVRGINSDTACFQPLAALMPLSCCSFPGSGSGVPFHWHGPGYSEVIFGRKVRAAAAGKGLCAWAGPPAPPRCPSRISIKRAWSADGSLPLWTYRAMRWLSGEMGKARPGIGTSEPVLSLPMHCRRHTPITYGNAAAVYKGEQGRLRIHVVRL